MANWKRVIDKKEKKKEGFDDLLNSLEENTIPPFIVVDIGPNRFVIKNPSEELLKTLNEKVNEGELFREARGYDKK